MKMKHLFLALFFLLVISITFLMFRKKTDSSSVPAYRYTTADLHNGLTTTLLKIGTTSFILRAEWSLDTRFPVDKIDVLFNLDLNPVYWAPIVWGIPVTPSLGWKEFEVPFAEFRWHKGGVPPLVGFFSTSPSDPREEEEDD